MEHPSALRSSPARLVERVSVAFDRLPIRTRLAGVSALLTFTILCAFALVVGSLTVHRIRSNFNREVAAATTNFASFLQVSVTGNQAEGFTLHVTNPPESQPLRKLRARGDSHSQHQRRRARVERRCTRIRGSQRNRRRRLPRGHAARSRSTRRSAGISSSSTVGVSPTSRAPSRASSCCWCSACSPGTGLALLAGMMIARRAMAPIAELTRTAEQIARTRDPSRSVPEPLADDEVAELARTLGGMLRELDAAHAETEATLARQRQFVADASHELRTPLTSVLANLELLAESLHGEEADAARSALRSSQRMRRLVADLLLLARTDVGRVVRREPCDLAQIVVEAAAELGPVSAQHEISLDVQPAVVEASRDELHRLALNLIENALRHTPPAPRFVSRREPAGVSVPAARRAPVDAASACRRGTSNRRGRRARRPRAPGRDAVRALRSRRGRPRRLLRSGPCDRACRRRVSRRQRLGGAEHTLAPSVPARASSSRCPQSRLHS